MLYIYTTEDCPRCITQKAMWTELGIKYVERSANRLKAFEDDIDKEALVVASTQNMELPVIVDSEDIVNTVL